MGSPRCRLQRLCVSQKLLGKALFPQGDGMAEGAASWSALVWDRRWAAAAGIAAAGCAACYYASHRQHIGPHTAFSDLPDAPFPGVARGPPGDAVPRMDPPVPLPTPPALAEEGSEQSDDGGDGSLPTIVVHEPQLQDGSSSMALFTGITSSRGFPLDRPVLPTAAECPRSVHPPPPLPQKPFGRCSIDGWDVEAVSVHHLEEELLLPLRKEDSDVTVFELVEIYVAPATAAHGCSYVDLVKLHLNLGPDHAGQATAMLSYSWNCEGGKPL